MLTVLTVLAVLFKFSTSGSAALLLGERKTTQQAAWKCHFKKTTRKVSSTLIVRAWRIVHPFFMCFLACRTTAWDSTRSDSTWNLVERFSLASLRTTDLPSRYNSTLQGLESAWSMMMLHTASTFCLLYIHCTISSFTAREVGLTHRWPCNLH